MLSKELIRPLWWKITLTTQKIDAVWFSDEMDTDSRFM